MQLVKIRTFRNIVYICFVLRQTFKLYFYAKFSGASHLFATSVCVCVCVCVCVYIYKVGSTD